MESALRDAGNDPNLRLIETMLWTGQTARHLDLHLARLARGARALGWADPTESARSLIDGLPANPARLRLDLDFQGRVGWQLGPVPNQSDHWRVGLACERLRSDDPWLAIKSNRRGAYDSARASLEPGLDEVILLNEKGQVCDGTITTVFFDKGQGLRTPPLAAGVLPGILRQRLACPEEFLFDHELRSVRLWVGNSLRGLIKAEFVSSPPASRGR